MGFSKKKDFFSKSLKVANLLQNAYQMVIILKNIISGLIVTFFFSKKSEKFERGEKLEKKNDEERFFLREKNDFIFLKAFFTKMGRRKICRW